MCIKIAIINALIGRSGIAKIKPLASKSIIFLKSIMPKSKSFFLTLQAVLKERLFTLEFQSIIKSNVYALSEFLFLMQKILSKLVRQLNLQVLKLLSYNYKNLININIRRDNTIIATIKAINGVVHTPYRQPLVSKVFSKNLLLNHPIVAKIVTIKATTILFLKSFIAIFFKLMPKSKPFFLTLQAVLVFSHISNANISNSMESFWGGLGENSNYTQGGVYKTQTNTYYSGPSV